MSKRPLSPAEQLEYLERARRGDIPARKDLAESYVRLVRSIVYRMKGTWGVDLEDVEQEGHLAVQAALNNYEFGSPMKLHNYVAWWVRAETARYMHSVRSVVRRGIKGNGGHSSAFDKSLDESLSAEYPDGDTRLDFLASECPSPEDNVISSLEVVRATQTMVQVSQLIPKMNKLRRSQIMELCSDLWRSRIYSETPDSLEEVAGRHGISRETARKIEGRLLTRVRTALKENP